MKRKLDIETKVGYIHYYLDGLYLGMFVFEKGELSDFRAVIRKNRLTINEDNLFKNIRMGLFELLNIFLVEKEFLDLQMLQEVKTKIVKDNDDVLKESVIKIIGKGLNNDR